MSSITITSYFTTNGYPGIGLSPTIRIWEIGPTGTNTLIIGTPGGTGNPGTGVGTDGHMTAITSGATQDGFYAFVFTAAMGYNPTKAYIIRSDAGITQNVYERFHTASIDTDTPLVSDIVNGVLNEPTSNHTTVGSIGAAISQPEDTAPTVAQIVNGLLNEPATNHTALGSIGAVLNQTQANTQGLSISLVDLHHLLSLLLKFETNRTKINVSQNTLTVYDDDCVTPLRTFRLLDSFGAPNAQDVCERLPQASGTTDGLPTCA